MDKKRILIDINKEDIVVLRKEAADVGTTVKPFIEKIIEERIKDSQYKQHKK